MPDVTGRRIGQYEVLEQIGRGSMAAVYRARDLANGRLVALKLIAPHLSQDPNFQRRFRREAEVMHKLQHPNITPVKDYGDEGGYAFLVMPFTSVGSLTDRMAAGPLGLSEGTRLVHQISAALQYAHDHGVVHRDVKPSNVLLDEAGNALLSDFGLARVQESNASMTGSMLVGTPAYISPEQARGEKATARSDQYSLGVILYQLTTGKLPFKAETPIAVALKHINEPLPPPRAVNPSVPEAVERVILKATAKDPRHRFESVAQMDLAYQGALAHSLDPASTAPPAIELLAPVQPTMALREGASRPSRLRGVLTRATGLAVAFMVVFPAFAAARVMGIGVGGEDSFGELDPVQLARLDGTIQAMSTELAGSRADLMRAEHVQTAVVSTLMASADGDTPNTIPSPTPTPDLEATNSSQPLIQLTPIVLFGGSQSATPTLEPSATPLAGPAATSTPTVVVSSTPGGSALPTASPSDKLAPTSTPTADVCSSIAIGAFNALGKEVSWVLVNEGSVDLVLTRLVFDRPASNGELKKIRLNDALIWNTVPPTEVQSEWKEKASLPAGVEKVIRFEFDAAVAAAGYSLLIEFDNGCQPTADG